MTGDDNPLTKGAKLSEGIGSGASGRTSLPANDLRVFLTALERLGHDRKALLNATGLDRETIDDPDQRIPCEAFGAVFASAQRAKPIRNLATHLALQTPIGAYPLLDYLILTSNTVGDGIKQLAKYFQLVEAPTTVEVREHEEPVRMMVTAANNPIAVEYTVALTVLNLRRETQEKCQAECVELTHKPDDATEMATLLGCPVKGDQGWSGVRFSRDSWMQTFRRRDPVLKELLERQADEIIARMPAGDPVVREVRRVLAKRVAGDDTRIDEVARELATTARTLQRRLAKSGVSYQELLEEMRCEAAEKHLRVSALSIAEVAYLLGYSEPSVLHRAFKRWKGVTPDVFRRGIRNRVA